MGLTTLGVEALDELVGEVLAMKEGMPEGRFLWFRGSRCNRYELLPTIMRDGKSSDEVFEREKRLLTRFRQRSIPYWPSGYPQNDWEHSFAMQHYGLPTRLLDWTENMFVAAHFALQEYGEHSEHDGPCVPAIYCLDPIGWNRSTPSLMENDDVHVLTTVDHEVEAFQTETDRPRKKTPIAMFGAHNSNRIVAQRGTFVVWGKETKSLEQFAEDMTGDLLWRVDLTADRDKLFTDLHSLGFGETMIFPELSFLAQELSREEGWR